LKQRLILQTFPSVKYLNRYAESEIVSILENAITELRTGLPWPFSYFTVRAIKVSETDDILYGLKLAGWFFFAQLSLLTLQLIALIVALGGATCNLIAH
jgi:hypothetical protein